MQEGNVVSGEGTTNLDCGPRRLHEGKRYPWAFLRRMYKNGAGWEAGDGGNFLSKQRNSMYNETEQRTNVLLEAPPRFVSAKVFSSLPKRFQSTGLLSLCWGRDRRKMDFFLPLITELALLNGFLFRINQRMPVASLNPGTCGQASTWAEVRGGGHRPNNNNSSNKTNYCILSIMHPTDKTRYCHLT